jgi:hypothetical protein
MNFAGVRIAALVGAGWADVRAKGGHSVRISLEAAQIYCIIARNCSTEEISPQSPKTPKSKAALQDAIHCSGLLPSAIDAAFKELQVILFFARVCIFLLMPQQTQGMLPNFLSSADGDETWSVLSTSTLPRSIITSSDGMLVLQWLFSQLHTHLVLDEAYATSACCVQIGVTPAIFASCLVDMERRGFIERVRGWICLLAADVDSSKLHSSSINSNFTSSLAQHIHLHGSHSAIPSCFERIVVLTPNITADEYGGACIPWTSSFASAAAITTADMEQDFLNIVESLAVSDARVHSQPMDELQICHVLKQGGGSVTELARASVLHQHNVAAVQTCAPCIGEKLCEFCSPKSVQCVPKLPHGHVFQMCPVCLEDKPCVVLPCGHVFCLEDLKQQISTAILDAETPVAAKGGQDAGGQSLFNLSCLDCNSRLSFTFISAIAPDLTQKLRKRLYPALLTSITGGSSPFARCSCGASVFIGVSHECEVLCDACGAVTTVGDCKRGIPTGSIYPHPGVTSDSAFQWYVHSVCHRL